MVEEIDKHATTPPFLSFMENYNTGLPIDKWQALWSLIGAFEPEFVHVESSISEITFRFKHSKPWTELSNQALSRIVSKQLNLPCEVDSRSSWSSCILKGLVTFVSLTVLIPLE